MDNKEQNITDEEKMDEIRKVLEELSKGQDVLKDKMDEYVGRLKAIYTESEFRHMYSEIYPVITDVDKKEDCNLETLAQNIGLLYSEIKEYHKGEPVYNGVRKLYDHVNLDIARINYLKVQAEYANKKLEDVTSQLVNISNEAEGLREKAQRMQREYVAILGVFSAIVVSFVSGLGFSSSVLANMHAVSPYRLVFVVMMLAIVLFNVLAVLMNFVRDMVFTGEKHRWLFIVVNMVFLAILIGDFIAWHCGMRIFPCQQI